MKGFWKILYPGLGVKRWVLALLLGLIMIMLAFMSVLLGVSEVVSPLRSFVAGLAGLRGTPLYLVLLLVVGLTLTMLAVERLMNSITVALAPRSTEKIVDSLYSFRYLHRGPKIVVIGGGTGMAMLLQGLKEYTSNLTAVVTVADDGGSSGRLRGDLSMPAPGDIRSCVVALADSELLGRLMQYRFSQGDGLAGHNFGNLFLGALTQMLGFQEAVKQFNNVLAIRGKVLPVTDQSVSLVATYDDDSVVRGESLIGKAGRAITRLEVDPADCQALPEVLDSIAKADAVVVGPGSLYTSLLPNLLVPGVQQAIRRCRGPRFFVCNIMTQQGETPGFSASRHLQVVNEHVGPGLFNYCVVNTENVAAELLEKYKIEGAEQVSVDSQQLQDMKVKVLRGNLLGSDQVAHHDSAAVARLLLTEIVKTSQRTTRWFDQFLLDAQLSASGKEKK